MSHAFTRNILGALALAGAALLPGAAIADGPQAIATAINHSGLASNGANIGAVRTHLQHVLNCLVGPGGQGFDAAPGNPCNAAGGAIPQTADAATKTKLEGAATAVRTALTNNDEAAAKASATQVQAMLR